MFKDSKGNLTAIPESFNGLQSLSLDDLKALRDHLGVSGRLRARNSLLVEISDELDIEYPPELMNKTQRTEANLAAMRVLSKGKDPSKLNQRELAKISRYSGWGGLEIKKVGEQKWPAGVERPSKRGLINEYYTPTTISSEIARVVAGLISSLPKNLEGRVTALEPSAGIGRFLEATAALPLDWHAVELMKLSHDILEARFQQAKTYNMSFEEFVADHLAPIDKKVGLMLANPPYGPRSGIHKDLDRVAEYSEGPAGKQAAPYFFRRTLDVLAPGGVGMLLVPYGIMLQKTNKKGLLKMREEVLKRHHLMGAFRLPTDIFPGASLPTDLLFFRARKIVLSEVLPSDLDLLEGKYFQQNRDHILGDEEGKPQDGKTSQDSGGRYKVVGEFIGLPDTKWRPMVDGKGKARVAAPARQKSRVERVASSMINEDDTDDVESTDLSPSTKEAIALGRRIGLYLALLTSEDAEDAKYRNAAHRELRDDLLKWVQENGIPKGHLGVSAQNKYRKSVQMFVNAFDDDGRLTSLNDPPPPWEPKFKEEKTPLGVLRHLWKSTLKPVEITAFARQVASLLRVTKASAEEGIRKYATAISEEFAIDPDPKTGRLYYVHNDNYYSGSLWGRFDRASATMSKPMNPAVLDGEAFKNIIRLQVEDLEIAIDPAEIEEIDASPTMGWVPIEVINAWVRKVLQIPNYPQAAKDFKLERIKSTPMLSLKGVEYHQIADALKEVGKGAEKGDKGWLTGALRRELKLIVGWCNGDSGLFIFKSEKDRKGNVIVSAAEKRDIWIKAARESFTKFLDDESNSQHADAVQASYNRAWRGYVEPTYSEDKLYIRGWSSEKTPHGYQNAAARRMLANNGGTLALDVGLGKTLTGLAVMGRAMQEGRAKRPIIVVPNSLALKWRRDILDVYPHLNVGLIGAKLYKAKRGKNKGKLVAKTDSSDERGQKWQDFIAGKFDVMVCTYTSMARQRMDVQALMSFVEQKTAIMSEVAAQTRKDAQKGKKGVSERDEAVLEQKLELWITDQLAIPKAWSYDTGVTWQQIQCDFLLVDEGQNFKNLYFPPRPIQFMGDGTPSKRAWQLSMRSLDVRQRGGFVGVLSATPAKNSPLEFYNIMELVNPEFFAQYGICHPWQFIDRYIKVEPVLVPTPDGRIESRDACVGFKNTHELRQVMGRYAEFKTADEIKGFKLPEVKTVTIDDIEMNVEQRELHSWYAMKYRTAAQSANPNLLGYLVRMMLTTVHPAMGRGRPVLDEDGAPVFDDDNKPMVTAYDWDTAEEVVDYASPKFLKLADMVKARKDCGHIVFVENVAAHRWIAWTLRDAGIPEDRITFLNGSFAKEISKRQQIADEFNGNADFGIEPKYDVIICNQVAYEGVDLQTRTCAIHHMDIPWEPATLQQRNGRGVRQGNKLTDIGVYYYIHPGTVEAVKLGKIDGKRSWLIDLVKSQDRETNNPLAGQADDGGTDLALLTVIFDGDEKKARAVYEKNKARASVPQDEKKAREAAKKYNALAKRAKAAHVMRKTKPRRSAKIREQIQASLDELALLPDHVWPWKKHHHAVLGELGWASSAVSDYTPPNTREATDEKGFAYEDFTSTGSFERRFTAPGLQTISVADAMKPPGTPVNVTRKGQRGWLAFTAGKTPTTARGYNPSWSLSAYPSPSNSRFSPELGTVSNWMQYRKYQEDIGGIFAKTINTDPHPVFSLTPDEFNMLSIYGDGGRLISMQLHRADRKWLEEFWRMFGGLVQERFLDSAKESNRWFQFSPLVPVLNGGKVYFRNGAPSRYTQADLAQPGDTLFEPSDRGFKEMVSYFPDSDFTYHDLTLGRFSGAHDAIFKWFGDRKILKKHFDKKKVKAPEPVADTTSIAAQAPKAIEPPAPKPAPAPKAAGVDRVKVALALAEGQKDQRQRKMLLKAMKIGGMAAYKRLKAKFES